MATFTRQHVWLASGTEDRDGQLIYLDGELIAVLVRLDGWAHGSVRGKWLLKAGFGPFSDGGPSLFDNLDRVEHWVEHRLALGQHVLR
jgi:hypothetical protein